ncbi:MAG: hypothetical protein EX272_10820 [Chromatiales bacterium]|nr:MAG: hypothetical protein EX272_10820 [Chromatiales bacterium]
MTRDPYNRPVRNLFAGPAHAGTLTDGVSIIVEDQGVRVELSARAEQGQLAAMRFRVWGCPHLIAATEWACDHYEAGPVQALEVFPAARIMEYLAVPTEKTGRILVLEDAIQALGRSLAS